MPLINVKLIENVFSPEQRREIIERLTDAMVTIEGENMRPVTWVRINEFEEAAWAIGGKALRASDIHALAAGKAA